MSYFKSRPTLLCLAILAAHHSALAQEETLVVTSQQTQHPVVATATRTATPTKLVPQTINSLPAEQLSAFNPSSLSAALVGTPGIDAVNDTRFDSVTIRGFAASNDFYLDGFRDDMQYTRDLGNIESVEILKGPAAVLYGRGSTGGIINRVSKTPQKGQASSINARIGSHDYQRLAADLSGELHDDVQVRLNMAQEDSNSFRDGVEGKRTLLAPSLRWAIKDNLDFLIQYERNEHHRTPDRGIPAVNGYPADVPNSAVYSDTKRDFIDDVSETTRSRLTWQLNDLWQLRQQLSYIKLDSEFDNTYVTQVKGDNVVRKRWQQQLNASNLTSQSEVEGQFNTGSINHRLLAGLELSWQERNPKLYQNKEAIPAGNLYQPDQLPSHNGEMSLSSDANHKVRSSGLYLQDQISLNNWHLLLGLRYDEFKVTTHRLDLNKEETQTSYNLSPRLGLVWNPVADHALYASYSKTFSPVGGGVIGLSPGNKANQLDPEHSRLYEIGAKSDWFDGRIASTLSLYRLEMYNRRMKDPLDPKIILLTGLQRTDGVELDVKAYLSETWSLRGAIGWQDAEIIKAENNTQGNRPSAVSKLNGQLFVHYQAEQGWFAETGMTAVGDRYADSQNTTKLPGYARFDARMGYQWQDWSTQLSVENVLDKDYYVSATGATQIMPGAPRQFYINASYAF
ncbi:TonB-dependent siderophore receptor [Vibrio anguillarum]|uniref:TonB-dependent siderophore receptor n=4 Tax=Vibrio anguillarum TaxID=55601 RepID=A0ABD4QXW2_VIBAN|nr:MULTISPECIES: TonB-dependent siderophore receptor [Vibrio]MBF4246403.1 TonB-dependent siderophore receptor [Vibrio anguillarum]MBT2919974.1 TonB-dependent siderophore receptor [Vibrio anguillarum]MCS0350781.1 TonB-dependent siderophore receptor [Vibrio ordalii]